MKDTGKISFIGYGVMAEAMIAGILKHGIALPEQLIATGPREERGLQLRELYKIHTSTDNVEAAKVSEVVVLSVKPQRLDKVLVGLRGEIQPDALVLSIVAGATTTAIHNALEHGPIVRAMPNTPAQIGEGITVWTTSSEVTEEQQTLAQKILSALGDEVFVEEESYLDMATAVSGTGPAYVFLFLEAMIDAGVHLGLPRRIAEKLVVQTLRGSVDYYDKVKAHPAALKNQVTSPGGTSAAALYYLEKAGFRTAISRAIWAAFERSQELGRGRQTKSPENHSNE